MSHKHSSDLSLEQPLIQSKLPNVGTSIFTEMSQLAIKTGAINLSQGFPEFETPQFLKNAVNQAITDGKNQYSASFGNPQLLDQIGKLVESRYQRQVDGSQTITVTSGATEALFVAIQAIVKTDDEVIIFDPAYDSYEPAVELAGGRCIHIPLQAPQYAIDWSLVEQSITTNTKAIIINSPHNPTGNLLNEKDMQTLETIICQHQLFLISDEVYEFITFDGERHQSALLFDKLFERTFVISSFGKTFHCTGWKMGYCVAPKALTVEFRKIHQYVTFCSPTPFQEGIAKMIANHSQHIDQLSAFYQQKRDCLINALKDSKLTVLPARGTYFLLVDYSQISELNDREFCHWLAKEKGLAAIPLSPFYQDDPQSKIVRLCFAKNDDTLIEAGKILSAL